MLFTDNGDKLNMEEREFVDNPDNAHLFQDPPSCEKHNEERTSNPAKRAKTSDDEVSVKS